MMKDGEPIEHGGDLDRAMARFGGARDHWLDLSTGINPHAYPLPDIAAYHWAELPDMGALFSLVDAAKSAYRTDADCLPVAGAQQAIQHYPALLKAHMQGRRAKLLHPSYNEHDIQLRRQGWQVESVRQMADLAGADLAVLVNPNNPDGQFLKAEAVLELAGKVGFLVVDESFCDIRPDISVCPMLDKGPGNILVLRSFGKFYGLAGLRLGFVVGPDTILHQISRNLGSWSVSGPALEIGRIALSDITWAEEMKIQLEEEASHLDQLAQEAGWVRLGGTSLFRLYDVGDAMGVQDMLGAHHIWSRKFSYAPSWLRLGLPPRSAWGRLEKAIIGTKA
ncbi:MAG: threonine-phosphate decarboxylase CobD [Candidatus Puniceispirillaceae bacterium]